MKRNFTRLLLSAVLMMCCMMMYAEIEPTEPQTDGNGNYELSTAAELYWFADYVNSGNTSANAILTADITVSDGVLDSNGDLNSGSFDAWTPIGGHGVDYSGEFDGNGHTISGLYFKNTETNNVGLFGRVVQGANIHNLGVKDSYFSGNNWVAGICGDFNGGRIENCWNAATVISNSNNSDGCCAGGIAASCWTDASVKGCYNIGKVTAQYDTQCGGICGVVNSTVRDCVTLDVCNAVCKDLRNNAQIINVAIKDIDAFKSGEVCWLLNNGVTDGSQKWFQTLETDDTPSLSTLRGTIFKITDDQGECEYANAECQHEQTYKSYQAAVCPTATTTGRYGHWHCSHCSTDFMDESCTIEATEENLTVPVATDNEIWYTTTDGNMCRLTNPDVFGTTIKSHKYENGLGVIEFNGNVTSIGDHAFWLSTSLQSISIPSGATSIGANAFDYCTSLQSISIPSDSKLTSIGEYAFYYCNLLQSISIPSGVTSIGEDAFYGCESLQSITFHSIPNVEEDAFLWLNIKNKTLDLNDSDKPYIGTSLENYPGGFTEANYHLTLAKDSWGTVVLPFVPSSESISNLDFYSYEGVDDGKVFVSKATNIQAGVPYLVKNVSEETTSFTLTPENPTITLTAGSKSADGFTFKVCFRSSDIAANSNLYYMNGTVFLKATQDNVAPLHAYIVAPETFEEESMDVVIWNPGTAVFVDGVIPTATTTGKYGYWRDESQNKYWNKFCTKPITDDSKLTVPVAKDNEIWYTSTDNYSIEPIANTLNYDTNEYQYGLGKIVLADDVTEIADNAFNRNKTLKSIFIPSAVKKVGDSSFYECTALESVIFSSLPDVDQHAFGNCGKLTTKVLDLKDGERPYIGTSLNNYPGFTEVRYRRTFEKNKWETVVLPFVPTPKSITGLEFYSYEGVDDGKVFVSVATNIQAGVPYLVKNVSEETTSFTLTPENPTITNLTAGSTSTDGFTFKGCFRSSDVAANSNLYYLDGTAFQKATQDNVAPLHAYIEAPETFGEVNMDVVIWNPETVPEFVDGVIPTATTTGKYGYWLDKSQNKFWTKFCARTITDDSELTVQVAKDNEIWYTTTDNYSIEPIANTLNYDTNEYQYGLGKIVLTDGVTEIADNAFKGKTTLMSMYIPSSVKKIGQYSFSGCTFLKSVLLSSGLEVIDDHAFDACTGLTSITIPGTVTRIGESVFVVSGSENKSLQTVTIPENSQLEIIDDNAFNRCRVLQSIRIPSSVKKIGNSSFWGCTALESVFFASLPNVIQDAFGSCGNLTTKVLDLKDGERPYIGTSLNNYPNGGFTQARFSISLKKNSWETVVLPFVPTNTDGLKFYSCSKVDGMTLEVKETAEIRAGVPYLVKNTSDSKTNFTLTATDQISIVLNTSDPESVNGFTLKGTFQTKDLNKDDSKKYYYWNGSVFYQVTAQQTVNPIHAYIETSDMSAVGFIIPTDQEGQVYGVLAIDDNYVLLNGSAGSYSLDKLELKYGHSYFCSDDFKATNSSYKLRVNPGKWNSWFVPFAVTTDKLGAKYLTAAYIAGIRQYEKDAKGNITTQVDIIKIKNARLRAGTPYLVKYDGEDLGDGDVLTLDLGETDFAASSDVHPLNSATTTASYDFIGCYEKAEFDISDKDMYYFMGSNGSLVHSKSNSFSALDWYLKVTPKGDVYDDLSTPSLAKSIIINVIGEEDETTGIRTLYPAEKQVKEVYDLSGRRLNAPKKGQINIINGKKLLVK